MPYLVDRPESLSEWRRQELLPATTVLLSTPADPAEGLVMAPVRNDADIPTSPTALALLVPWAYAGRVQHVHFKLIEAIYRNGEPVVLSNPAVLGDRDCLTYRLPDGTYRVFYDAFACPQVAPYAGPPLECTYCRQPIAPGMFTVRCPGCGLVLHHDWEGTGCWVANERCPRCGIPTALDQEPTWRPAGFV